MTRLAVPMVFLIAACGGGAASTKPAVEPEPEPLHRTRVVPEDDGGGDGSDDGVEIVSERGHMEESVISAGIEPGADALQACYIDNLAKRRWLGGKVVIKWDVDAKGAITKVRLSESDLGAWPIEQCLLGVAGGLTFGKPKGGPADFTVPLEFTAKGQPVWWDQERSDAIVSKRLPDLAPCDEAGAPAETVVTVYVGTRGKVQSVGFSGAGDDPVAAAWGDCAAGIIGGWTLSDPKGKVAKLAFRYPG